MKISILVEQRRVSLNRKAIAEIASSLATHAETHSPQNLRPWREVTIHLVDNEGIAPIHQAILEDDTVTDVITQRYDPLPGEPDGLQGELFVNAERAVEVAATRAKWSPDQELALYIAHGCDHLSGADDATPAEYNRMRRRELRWLRECGIQSGSLVRGS